MLNQSIGGSEATRRDRRFSEALALFAETIESERVDLVMLARFMGERSIGALHLVDRR